MLFSYNWLKEYVKGLASPRELADALTMTGTEVESVTEAGPAISNVITAQVLSCDKHPNADRLQLCQVKTDTDTFSIVCGARNMKPGDKVALALNGAELPGGFKIKKSKIRGVESQGMMCSESELGLKETSEGILILPEDTPLGRDLKEVLGLDDSFLEVGITPNRADLLSIRGLAREIGAVTGAIFKGKSFSVPEVDKQAEEAVSVSVETDAPCKRYCARVVEGVAIGPSPEFIKKRLEASGVRAVNNVVDITNYVLLELGQPLHAFDLDKIEGRSIDVRLAGEDETLITINGKERKLEPEMLVIADGSGPVALAGVMGGQPSEVTDSTKNILLEAAWFEPSTVRRTSRKTGLSTDSSYRFERGIDISRVPEALYMAAEMIQRLAGGKVLKGVIDSYPVEQEPAKVDLRVERAREIIGVDIKEDDMASILERLGMNVSAEKPGELSVSVPAFRVDITREIDLVEEIARVYGFGRIPVTYPASPLRSAAASRAFSLKRRVKEALTGAGLLELINYNFVSRQAYSMAPEAVGEGVTILNPLTEDQVVMRASILPSLLDNLRYNLQRKNEEVKAFEVAPVFVPREAGLPEEKWKVAGVLWGLRWGLKWNFPKEWVDFYDVKGLMERLFEELGAQNALKFVPVGEDEKLFHPGKSAYLLVNGKKAGVLGETHPDMIAAYDLKKPACLFEIDLGVLDEAAREEKRYTQLPKFPESARDIAFVAGVEVPYAEIINSIGQLDTKLIEKVELFDVYYGGNIPQGKRSMALRIVYRSSERTLTSQEIEELHSRVTATLVKKFGAEVRS